MVDGVNFNPFTGKVFSTDEINKMDANKDGIVSYNELQSNISWLSQQKDDEGDIQIDNSQQNAPATSETSSNGSKVYDAAAKNGVKDTAQDANQLKQYITTIQDEYIQQYIQSSGMPQEQRASFIAFVKSETTAFLNDYLAKNTKAPFDVKQISSDYVTKMDELVSTRSSSFEDLSKKIEDMKNTDVNFDSLAEYADKADNDYVTAAEFQKMKEDAISYLMGQLLNGTEDAEFLKSLDANYQNNSYYKVAKAAIEALKNETDPAKMQELIDKAQSNLDKLIGTQNADGTSKLNNAINSRQGSIEKQELTEKQQEYKNIIQDFNDKLIENYSNTRVSAQDVENYQARLDNAMNVFLQQYKGDGSDLKTQYNMFLSKLNNESAIVQNEMNSYTSKESYESYDKLQELVQNSGTYVSNSEKAAIKDATIEFMLNQLGQGITDISLLEQVYPGYKQDANFVEAQNLINGLSTSATPKEDMAKIKELLAALVDTIGVDKLVDGVKNKPDTQINFNDVDMEKFTSSIPGYDDNTSISSGRYKNSDSAVDDIQNKAKEKLESIRPQLLEMLKQQLGADYDEDRINKMIDDAIYKTVNDLTESGFNVDKHGAWFWKKYSASIDTKQLVDTFMTNFKGVSDAAAAEKDPNKNPIDRESVMRKTSYADAYQDKDISIRKRTSEAKLEAKTILNEVSNELKAQLKQELGSDYNSAVIDSLISKATLSALDSIREIKSFFRLSVFNVTEITNKFFDEFDKLYEDYKKQK